MNIETLVIINFDLLSIYHLYGRHRQYGRPVTVKPQKFDGTVTGPGIPKPYCPMSIRPYTVYGTVCSPRCWPFPKFPKNPSGWESGLTYHCPGSSFYLLTPPWIQTESSRVFFGKIQLVTRARLWGCNNLLSDTAKFETSGSLYKMESYYCK